jgi:hypothetical protein
MASQLASAPSMVVTAVGAQWPVPLQGSARLSNVVASARVGCLTVAYSHP